MYRIVAIFFFACLLSTSPAYGQLGLSGEQVTLNTRPQVIQPLQDVALELESYNTDLNRAQISFYIDGVLQSKELGKTKYTVTAPAVGSRSRVQFVINTIGQGTVTKEFLLAPAQVDLIAEAVNSYAPPMYQGRRLPSHEGGVTVHALPYMVNQAGAKLDPNSLVYSWKLAGKAQLDASGYGKQSFSFKGSPLYRTKEVEVQVESVDGQFVARRSIELPAYDPVIRFYQEHPLWGVDLSQAIVADRPLYLDVPEMKVRSVPFFVSDVDNRQLVSYDWRMNGQVMSTFGDRNVINLRAPDDQEGRTRISLKINHNSRILQIAESLFTVVFGERSGSSTQNRGSGGSGPDYFGTGN